MTHALLFRHTEPVGGGSSDRCKGSGDDPELSPRGDRHMRANVEWILNTFSPKDLHQAVIVTSDMKRTKRMGEHLSKETGMEHIPDERLQDLHTGRWTGMTWGEIKDEDPDLYFQFHDDARGFTFPEGDSVDAFQQETLQWWREVMSQGRGLFFACLHRGHNSVILHSKTPEAPLKLTQQKLGCMNRLQVEATGELTIIDNNRLLYNEDMLDLCEEKSSRSRVPQA